MDKNNIALAYAVKRRAKKMNAGGDISNSFSKASGSSGASSAWGNLKKAVGMADGGLVSKIREKLKSKKMYDGGEVESQEDDSLEYLDGDMDQEELMDNPNEGPSEDKKDKIKKHLAKLGK